ncbi:terminal uridylyltransferase Tailor-like [Anopheles maculipalpis]|uniref:terminal uridylyltransferase Tailor-like n=1 Tax=Anopheles maculipalpis TaxID=1496333 RepID=UPI002158B206|nr:terminal uridylyltransferase Tailor-like [Anopheles maculipalpis]
MSWCSAIWCLKTFDFEDQERKIQHTLNTRTIQRFILERSKNYFSTNVIIETLIHNLAMYDSGPKNIDAFTLDQIEQLMDKMKLFLEECTLVPFEEDKKQWNKLLAYYYQQPNVVRCRVCSKCLNEYEAVMDHIKMHERQTEQAENVPKPVKMNYMVKNCIPRTGERLSKNTKKFLTKNPTTIVKSYLAESNYVQIDIDNDRVQQHLEKCLKKDFPSVKLYPFGSRVSGTGSLSSDLDVFVDLQNGYFGRNYNTKPDELTELIERVQDILRSTKRWTIEAIILNARVPLLRVISLDNDLHCDLTFSNGLAHRNSMLLQYLFTLQPTSRMLVCYLKNWNRENCLNAYTLSLMVIYMYQCHKWLPSVAKLQEDPSNDIIIDDWNGGFATPTLQELNIQLLDVPIPELVNMFFELYSLKSKCFSVESHVICPYIGEKNVTKSSFELSNCDGIPPQMERLKRYMLKHQDDKNPRNQFAYNRPLVVQDPFEHCHNVAKAIPVEIAARLMRSIDSSLEWLGAAVALDEP